MSLRNLTQRWWRNLLFPLVFFCLGWGLLPYPGLQNDEVLFVNAHFRVPGATVYQAGSVPLMLMTYLGALKTCLYAPILWLCRPSYVSVRLPVLVLGAVTVWLFVRLLESAHGWRAAWVGGLLLATDTMFLLTTCFDWGPVALQHFFLVAGMLLVLRFCRSSARSVLFCGFLCFGLGLWDKALFLWMLTGLVVATILVFPRELWTRLTVRNVLLAIAGFSLGALPLLVYNATSGFPTLRSNRSFVFDQFQGKAVVLRGTWNGSALFGYLAGEAGTGNARDAAGPVQRVSFGLHSALGEHRTNRLEGAFYAALLLTPVLCFTRARRILLFCLVALGVAWLQMAITGGAGAAAHHTVLLWPVPHLFLAVGFAEASARWRITGWLLAVAMVFLAGGNLLVTNQYFYQLVRYGPGGSWTDAIYGLSDQVGRMPASQIVIDDWGLVNPLVLLHQGKLPIVFAGDRFLSPTVSDKQRNWDRGLLEQGLWLGHTAEYEVFAGANDRIAKAAASAGFRKELLHLISDRNGRAVFEIFRFVRAN